MGYTLEELQEKVPHPITGLLDEYSNPRWIHIAWLVIGELENSDSMFGGSKAEAVEDALNVASAIIFNGVTTAQEYQKLRLLPEEYKERCEEEGLVP